MRTDCPDSPIHQFSRLQQQLGRSEEGYLPGPAPAGYVGDPSLLPPPSADYPSADLQQAYMSQPISDMQAYSQPMGELHYAACDSMDPSYVNSPMMQSHPMGQSEYPSHQQLGSTSGHMAQSHVGGDWMVHTKI